MRKGTRLKQHDITDCGPTCLASVAAFHGLRISMARIRQMASTDQKGTNILGLIEAAQKLGFSAKGVKGPPDALYKIPKPAIAHVVVNNLLHHFVVIYAVKKSSLSIMDPASGKMVRKTKGDFLKEWTGILVLLMPTETFVSGNIKTPLFKRFVELITPFKYVLVQAFCGAALYSVLGLSTSIFVQKLVDYVFVDGNLNLLNLMGIVMAIILLIRVFIGSVKSQLAVRIGQKIDAVLVLGYYRHILKLPQQFFDTMRIGEIISRINDAIRIRAFINSVFIDTVVNLFIVIFTLLLMATYSWKLTLIVTFAMPLFIGLYMIFNKLNSKYLRRIMEDTADIESHFVESLRSISTIKRFGVEEYSNLKTESRFIKLLKSTWSSAQSSIYAGNLSELVSGGVTLTILWIGSGKVLDQEITPGILMSFYALTGYLLNPVASLINTNQSIQDAGIAADRLFQIMDLEWDETGKDKLILTSELVSDIKFKNVSFRYGSRQQVFTDLSLTIPKGKITAIIGESGCGKTTLLSLLQHLYPVQSGIIEIGEYPINHISSASLRKIVSTVPQEIDLFSGSIIENIALGDFEPDVKRILEISKALKIDEFVEKLPHGYLTLIGEHGVSLSGGEKQRIAIARAIYKNPEILILDEATSALDSYSEAIVKESLKALRESGKTIIVITHRISSIFDADLIVYLQNGSVAESGSHHELMALKQKYFSFFEKNTFMHIVNL